MANHPAMAPGNPAYNASKSAVKSITEALEHDLRNTEGCQVSAHLLVPGFTYTGLVREFLPEKPDSAWVPDQVVAFMVESLERGDFYILCPDNDVTREMDNKRIAWAMGDLIEARPALSRWHPDYLAAFEAFMKS
jgi:short-subunit dehydrogenase